MLLYKGEETDLEEMAPEQAAQVIAQWDAWMRRVGPALVDFGTPFGTGHSVVDDGTAGAAVSLSGYSVVEAVDLDEVLRLTEGHPYLSEGQGAHAIDIYELTPVPMMD